MKLLFLFGIAYSLFDGIISDEPEDLSFTGKYAPRKDLDPVILIPGLGGSRVEYTLKNESKWKPLWLDVSRALPGKYEEWIRQLTPVYDVNSDTYTSQPDLSTRPIDYGGVEGVRYLDSLAKNISGYYNVILTAMEQTGYKIGKNVFGAPFDWRLANAKQIMTNGMCEKLKALVEKAASLNPGKKVHLVGHSMGCTFIQQFLRNYVPEGWRKRYVASFISISGPYGGSFEAYAHLASLHKWGSIPIPSKFIHKISQTLGGIFWMLPNFNAYSSDTVLARIPKANMVITMGNMTQTWISSNRSEVLAGVRSTMNHVNQIDPPQVPTYILYSNGQKTLREIQIDGPADSWWQTESKTTLVGDGDGTVPIESLMAPLRWKNQQAEPVTSVLVENVGHFKILKEEKTVNTILDVISRD
ncbi:putative lysophospholipase III [Monocercomonoides exilis]|uniref:putative lysophospholipase III n=1 Tax=Monocercomonoides exilis TaxID=2049356 RepID=UPI003559B5B8|nr:putative lysophospholipase III [Monocercomonoides exilis]|eukprot:MONOS_6741.1-p1 / transcript=MONOS_6741.1 / gene=MONOS_6741 / organism=Monocercomonoides_exilis_PA203 / gene_product=lysophospholipase III [EC:3.1.1.5] / transcript_product=lysophospholipase III [EC:3.1.1.5] / location=Mono_scaffold00218:28674-30252(+) / protein_length=414 / sequence_SO=supercontig / SO=protein_coding / is_pseudo=false